MAAASDYLENALLDHLFGKSTFSSPTIYVALCTSAPVDADTGSTITEANYGSYARVSTSASDWDAAASGLTDNANAITFPTSTSSGATITHFALVDASSGGNLLIHGALTASLAIGGSGITPEFAAGALDISCG